MKEHTLILLIILCLICCLRSYGQKVIFEKKEFLIDLDTADRFSYDYFISPKIVSKKVSNFNKNVKKVWRTKHPMQSHDIIPMTELLRLYKLADKTALANNPPDKKYLTGLQLNYFVKNNKIHIYYSLWYLKDARKEPDSIRGTLTEVKNKYFYLNNEKLKEINPKKIPRAKRRFKKKMRMKRNGRYKRFLSKDTESAMFSFQELFFLYHLNYTIKFPNREIRDPNYTYKYKIVSIEGVNIDSDDRELTAMFNCEECVTDEKPLVEPGYGANLAHLCPPRCNNGSIVFPAK